MRSRDELASCKNEVTALERKLQSKETEVQAISKEVNKDVLPVLVNKTA